MGRGPRKFESLAEKLQILQNRLADHRSKGYSEHSLYVLKKDIRHVQWRIETDSIKNNNKKGSANG